MKLKVEQILKPGAKLKVKQIDFTDPKVLQQIENCKRLQMEVLERKKVDLNKLRNLVITI